MEWPWERFGLHLPGISGIDLETIEKEKSHRSIPLKKLALYKKWLKKHPSATWNDVIKALETIETGIYNTKHVVYP